MNLSKPEFAGAAVVSASPGQSFGICLEILTNYLIRVGRDFISSP